MPRSMQDQSGGQQSGAAAQSAQGAQGGQGMPDTATSQGDRPGGGLGTPIDTPGPLHKYRWWILSAIGLLLVVAAAFMLRGQPAGTAAVPVEPEPSPLTPTVVTAEDTVRAAQPATPAAKPAAGYTAAPAGTTGLLQALKEELFALETERVEGKLTEAQYAEVKAAVEVVLRRALSRRS